MPVLVSPTAPVGNAVASRPAEIRGLSAINLLDMAGRAARVGRAADADQIYRSLEEDPDQDIRLEARFRRARLSIAAGHLHEAATLLRQILDERPTAQPARLELAAVLARIGDLAGARRELRSARAGQLPPEVARIVDRYSQALRAAKPFGGSLNVSLAADSNINRATRADTLGTIIGDFTLSDEARASSGVGAALDGQAYARLSLGKQKLVITGLGSANLYRRRRFDDVSLGAKAGPELAISGSRLSLTAGFTRRWFGGARFTDVETVQADLLKPISATAQLRLTLAASHIANLRNPLESGHSYAASLLLEKALSPRLGIGASLTGIRQSLGDPGYSTTSAQLGLFAYREVGRMTVTAALSAGRLIADERLFLYPQKRAEWSTRATLGATFRRIELHGFSPTAQLSWERNRSSIAIYDYRRTALEFGIARAF